MNQSVQNITEDFQIFLSYLKSKKEVSLTKDGMKLKSKDLFEMNQLVHNQALWVTEKNPQMRFTIFNFFYWISIYGKLTKRKKNAKGESIFEFDNERVEDFLMLNTSEQYCFILKTSWCDMNWEKLYDDRSTYFIEEGVEFLRKSPTNTPVKISPGRNMTDTNLRLMRTPYCEFFAYMGWFEIVHVQHLKKYNPYELPFVSISTTVFGKKISEIFTNQRTFVKNNLHSYFYLEEDSLKEEKGDFIEPFKNLFDEPIEHILELPPHEFVGGKYTFKLEIDKKSYRIIEINGNDTLFDLHDIVQEALKFENDHMFSFKIGDEEEIIGNPWGEGNDGLSEQLPEEVRLGDIEFYIGQTIDYCFDFGDNWHFNIILLEINSSAKPLKSAKIIEKVGKAPKQYDWDE